MSTVENYNLIFFGQQSPYHKIRTESNVHESLSYIMHNLSSKVFRQRSFKAYSIANLIFRDGNTGVSQQIRNAVESIFDPLLEHNAVATKSQAAFNAIKETRLLACETALTNEFKNASGIKNTAVMIVDSGIDSFYNQKGISVFLSRNHSNFIEKRDLEVTWESKFFKFKNPETLSLIVVIPRSYLFYLVFSVQSSATVDIRDNTLPIEKLRKIMTDAFIADLMRAFLFLFIMMVS